MATRSSIKFIKEDEIVFNLYSHYDGYPEGMAYKLVQAANNSIDFTRTFDVQGIDLINAFIIGNPTSRLTDTAYHGNQGEEYLYSIDCNRMTIKMTNCESRRTTESTLADFINQWYQPQNDKDAKDNVVKTVRGILVTRKLAKKAIKILRNRLNEFIEYSNTNPNIPVYQQKIKDFTF